MQNILERLDAGEVVIGDGSYCSTLEKRGYVKVIIHRYFLSYCSSPTAPAGRLLHAGELGGAPGGGGGPGRGVRLGRGGHHPDLHPLQQGRRHARGVHADGEMVMMLCCE